MPDSRPGGAVYFAALVLPAFMDLARVTSTLGVESDETAYALTRLVSARMWPEYVGESDAIVWTAFNLLVLTKDPQAFRAQSGTFIERLWAGYEPSQAGRVELVGSTLLARFIDRARGLATLESAAEDAWSVPPEWAELRSELVAKEELPRTYVPPRGEDGHPNLAFLFGSAFDLDDPVAVYAVDIAVGFGSKLARQIATDLQTEGDGAWCGLVAVIGFCVALPAVSAAFETPVLLSASTLVEAARRVDLVSDYGFLIQTLASGDIEQLLREAAVAMKEAATNAGIEVSDLTFAGFPTRLAVCWDAAQNAASRRS